MKRITEMYCWIVRIARVLNMSAGVVAILVGGLARDWWMLCVGIFFVFFASVVCPVLIFFIKLTEEL